MLMLSYIKPADLLVYKSIKKGKMKRNERQVTLQSMNQLETSSPLPPIQNQECEVRNDGLQRSTNQGVSMRKRFRNDPQYRKRFIHTIWLFWAYIGLGWMSGQIGPSFHDLRLIMDADLDTASWLFTIFYIGSMSGSFFGGLLFDRINKLLFIAVTVMILALSSGLLPWCQHFSLMLVARFFTGIGAGSFDTGGNADMLSIWGSEGGPYMQALHFCFGLGGIISPLITEPFLAAKTCMDKNLTDEVIFVGMVHNNLSSTTSTLATASNNVTCLHIYGETKIYFAYLISLIVIASSSIPFFVMYAQRRCYAKAHTIKTEKEEICHPNKLLNLKLKTVLLLLLGGIMLFYNAVEETFAGYLATFCTRHFNWSTEVSSYATSTLWASFSFGRFTGIFVSRCFKPATLLASYNLFLILSLIGLLISSLTLVDELVWVFVSLAGFAMSIIFASVFTWTEESILKVSGTVSSILIIAGSVGLMLNPLLLGFLMENFSPLWFIYLLLAESCLCFTLFLVLHIVVNKCVKLQVNTRPNVDVTACHEEVIPLDILQNHK